MESTPPDKKAPSGTSATRCARTDSSSNSSNSSSQSSVARAQLRLELQLPVFPRFGDPSVKVTHQHVGRGQPTNTCVDRRRCGHVAVPQIQVQRLDVNRWDRRFRVTQRCKFRAERQVAGSETVIEWLDPQVISRQQQTSSAEVDERKGEHAPETPHAVVTPLLVRVHDDFRVALRAKAVPVLLELTSQLTEVVDLSVVADPDLAVLVGQRLLPSRGIDNR